MISADEGWAVGRQADGGAIVHYQDGQWLLAQITVGAEPASSKDMLSASAGWSVREQGTILHYSDGFWSQDTSPTARDLRSVSMVSPADGWAVGDGNNFVQYEDGAWR